MKKKLGALSVDSQGRAGASVQIDFDPEVDGWGGSYQLATHGKTADEVRAEHDRIVAYHRQKAARMPGLQKIRGTLGKGELRDCTIRERGTNVEVVIRAVAESGEVLILDVVVPAISDVPSDQEIREIARTAIATRSVSTDDHAAMVRAALGI